jgi:hypothetical protein
MCELANAAAYATIKTSNPHRRAMLPTLRQPLASRHPQQR